MKIIDKKVSWQSIIENNFTKLNDIYFNYDYFNLFSENYKTQSEGIFWKDSNIAIFWTHLIRSIRDLEPFNNYNYYDLISPYGYGGPLLRIYSDKKSMIISSLQKFWSDYKDYCGKKKYISEFIRFHPILNNSAYFSELFNINSLNDTVTIDLTDDQETIKKKFSKNKRYQIRKSIREKCTVELYKNPPFKKIKAFLTLYNNSMDRNEASDKYYFSQKFIEDHFKFLGENCILGNCIYKDDIVTSSLFLHKNDFIHYHLSGTKYIKGIYPNDLIIWEMCKWAKSNGKKYFHLGGGRGSNDSLFHFKKGFSETYFTFKIASIIYDSNIYNKLTNENKQKTKDSSFFPKYRENLSSDIL